MNVRASGGIVEQQVHIGAAEWDGALQDRPLEFESYHFDFGPVIPAGTLFKPQGVGFWTCSSRDGDAGEWSRAGAFRSRAAEHPTEFRYQVVGQPRIIEFGCDADILGLARSIHPLANAEFRLRDIAPFWQAVARHYDAVHVPIGHERRGLLMLWDVESTLWLRPTQHLRLVDRRALHLA